MEVKLMTPRRWHKPQMVRTEFTGRMDCACACSILVGAGSGGGGDVPRDPC
jgi:hypothetical protein